MRTYYNLLLVSILVLLFTSCEGCVKSTTKKITNVGLSVVEGAIEAIDEKGEHLSEKVTDVAGKAALGIGKSLDKQLNEHAKSVASVAGRTMVQGIDGLSEGLETELNAYYNNIPYTEDLPTGVGLVYFAKYTYLPVVDAYFVIPEEGDYTSIFECYDQNDNVFSFFITL